MIMNINDIKKQLYKQKPFARLQRIVKNTAIYSTDGLQPLVNTIHFHVPIDDMGDAVFYPEMESHLLIRYLSWETEQIS